MANGPMTLERFRHVNDHLTPLAILVVAPGLVVAPLSRLEITLGVVLLACAVVMNYLSIILFSRHLERMGKIRVVSNYAVNIVLVWLLYRVWSVVWLLLLLMAIGPAVYQGRRDAMLTGAAVALYLIVVHGLSGSSSPLAWAEVAVKACAIVMFSLFVNGLPTISKAA